MALRWIALLDVAEEVRAAASPLDPVGMRKGSQAIDSLFLFEHTLTATERRLARTLLWQRDHLDPLPEDTTAWERCRCRRCLREGRIRTAPVAPDPVQVTLAQEVLITP